MLISHLGGQAAMGLSLDFSRGRHMCMLHVVDSQFHAIRLSVGTMQQC